MFRTWIFSEFGYPFHPPSHLLMENRVNLPSKYFDPDAGYELYNKVFDLYRAADELGMDVMVNEHHSTSTCLNTCTPLTLSVLARETKQARMLCLGNPMAHRPDPVRVAEEMAMVDVISGGRLDLGMIRGVPQEHFATNASGIDMKERLWEAIDLMIKTLSTHDGPFSWEGKHFHYREVNIWPRPYQQPHPPLWMSTLSADSAADLCDRDFTIATLGNGWAGCAAIFEAYRKRAAELGRPAPPAEKFAYSPLMYVGDSWEDAKAGIKKVLVWAHEQLRSPSHFNDIPGYMPPQQRAMLAKVRASGGTATLPSLIRMTEAPLEDLIAGGEVMAGTPEMVFEQLRDFHDKVGGFGNLLPLVHFSTMNLDLVVRSMERFATDVLPRFREEVYEPTVRGDRELLVGA